MLDPNGIRVLDVMSRPASANPKAASRPNTALPCTMKGRAANPHHAPAAAIRLASPPPSPSKPRRRRYAMWQGPGTRDTPGQRPGSGRRAPRVPKCMSMSARPTAGQGQHAQKAAYKRGGQDRHQPSRKKRSFTVHPRRPGPQRKNEPDSAIKRSTLSGRSLP